MRIDRLVCGLYGLTDDEIRLVEEELQADPAMNSLAAAVHSSIDAGLCT